MNNMQALKELVSGKRIRRLNWKNKNKYIVLTSDGVLLEQELGIGSSTVSEHNLFDLDDCPWEIFDVTVVEVSRSFMITVHVCDDGRIKDLSRNNIGHFHFDMGYTYEDLESING